MTENEPLRDAARISEAEEDLVFRSEALLRLDRHELGRAFYIGEDPYIVETPDGGQKFTAPNAYALPMNTDRTQHLVLCLNGRMAIVEQPIDNPVAAKDYQNTFVSTGKVRKQPGAPPDSMVFKGKLVSSIPDMIHHFGLKGRPHHTGFVAFDTLFKGDRHHFPAAVMQAVNVSCGLRGLENERPGIEEAVMGAFIDRGKPPFKPAGKA